METEEQKAFLKDLRELLDKHQAIIYTQPDYIGVSVTLFKEDSEIIFEIL